jgi:pimeloyl-ACP methyl ester carboxylesterase
MYRPSAAGARPAPPIPHWPGRLVTVGAGEVYVRATPAQPGAEPALFVHGLGGSSTNWTDLMDQLRQPEPAPDGALPGWPAGPPLACEAVDLPGNGHSPPAPDGDYTIAAQADVVAALIERAGRGPVHLAGNSLGGAVCTRLAAQRPDLVRTLTLISPALPDLLPRLVPARVSTLRIPGFGRWMVRRAAKIPARRRVEVTLHDVYFDVDVVHPDRIAEEVAEVEREDGLGYAGDVLLSSAKGLITEYFHRRSTSLWRDAAKVSADVLVVYGSHDRLVDPRMAGRAARTFRHSRVVVLPRTGHVAQMERPADVAAEMRIMMSGAARRATAVAHETSAAGTAAGTMV